jgi:predicted ATPase/DNA-binding winged helix-turn-helix (wHTH) protein
MPQNAVLALPTSRPDDSVYLFGPFSLDVRQRRLSRNDEPVEIGGRALDLLIELVRRAGKLVDKREIVALVWPNQHVEESNLRVHVRALRNALGDRRGSERYIATIAGRGYAFVAPVGVGWRGNHRGSSGTVAPPTAPALPVALTHMVGRGEVLRKLARQVQELRLVSIVGAGGIGKTTVALAVARVASAAFDGVFYVDLATVNTDRQVASAVAAALRIPQRAHGGLLRLTRAMNDMRALLVLDNCEHVIEGSAAVIDAILKGANRVHVLTTSREVLRAEGEWVHRLSALEAPPPGAVPDSKAALAYPAVRLFAERAAASTGTFELTDDDTGAVAEITRRLDGIPLAIEFAAGLVGLFGVRDLAAALRDHFTLLNKGRRTALPRHRTMAAALDWSYNLLSPRQQRTLCRLAIFIGPFSLRAATAIDATDGSDTETLEILSDIWSKSLLSHESGGYRLLETTRAYALDKLRQSGEHQQIARRHAIYVLRAMQKYDPAAPERLQCFDDNDANIRAALDWAFSPHGDPEIGIDLTLAATPYWTRLSQLSECYNRLSQALPAVTGGDDAAMRRRLALLSPMANAALFVFGVGKEVESAGSQAIAIAEALDDVDWLLRVYWGLWYRTLNVVPARRAAEVVERFRAAAARSSDAMDRLVGERLVGFNLHIMGDQEGARRHIERMIAGSLPRLDKGHIERYQLDQVATARTRLAKVTWLQGWPDQAMHAMEEAVRHVISQGHPLTICGSLVHDAIPVALYCGDMQTAERYLAVLVEWASRISLHTNLVLARFHAGHLAVRRGDVAGGARAMRDAVEDERNPMLAYTFVQLRIELAECHGLAGDREQGSIVIDNCLAECERNEVLWCMPEALRVKAGLETTNNVTGAEAFLRRGLDMAQRQKAPSLALRCATDLAALLRRRGRDVEARSVLATIYGGFVEGFGTSDLVAAKRLLDELA